MFTVALAKSFFFFFFFIICALSICRSPLFLFGKYVSTFGLFCLVLQMYKCIFKNIYILSRLMDVIINGRGFKIVSDLINQSKLS